MVLNTNTNKLAVTMAEKAPGDQVPMDPIRNPPMIGVRMLVMLSREVLKPRIPPISSRETDLVNVLRKTVFKTLEATEMGISTISKTPKLGVNAQARYDRLKTKLAPWIKRSSLKALVKRPIAKT